MKQNTTSSNTSFNRLYFVNLFAGSVKYSSLHEAKAKTNLSAVVKIAEKLTGQELEILNSKIESLL